MDWLKKMIGVNLKEQGIADQWHANYARQVGGFSVLLDSQFDPFARWPPAQLPALQVDLDLESALLLKYVRQEEEVSKALIDRALAVAERIRDEKLCDTQAIPSACHLTLECAEAYARWLKTGILDIEMLRRAYDFALEGIRNVGDEYFEEGFALAAARIALISDSPASVEPALASVKRWKYPAAITMRDALRQVAEAIDDPDAANRQTAVNALDELFAVYRVPFPDKASSRVHGSIATIRFELAVLCATMRTGETGLPLLQRAYEIVTR